MKKQVIAIHGADSFDSYEKYFEALKKWEVDLDSFLPKNDWKTNLQKDLGDDFEVLTPRMPNSNNARYLEWEIWFEKMFPFVRDGVMLVGHSQGGIFLAKYLSIHNFPKKIGGLFLVAAPHTEANEIGDFAFEKSIEGVPEQCQNIHLYQSQDDPVVPYAEMDHYKKSWPSAETHTFTDREHFRQKHFSELVEDIKNS